MVPPAHAQHAARPAGAVAGRHRAVGSRRQGGRPPFVADAGRCPRCRPGLCQHAAARRRPGLCRLRGRAGGGGLPRGQVPLLVQPCARPAHGRGGPRRLPARADGAHARRRAALRPASGDGRRPPSRAPRHDLVRGAAARFRPRRLCRAAPRLDGADPARRQHGPRPEPGAAGPCDGRLEHGAGGRDHRRRHHAHTQDHGAGRGSQHELRAAVLGLHPDPGRQPAPDAGLHQLRLVRAAGSLPRLRVRLARRDPPGCGRHGPGPRRARASACGWTGRPSSGRRCCASRFRAWRC